MGRPVKCRRIAQTPDVTYFKPAGIPLRELDEVQLSFEEMEALRLKDHLGLEQEQCAIRMNISRQTFQRVLASARKKTIEALLFGKAIRIEGGHFDIAARRFRCQTGHEWEADPAASDVPGTCPVCNTNDIQPMPFNE